LASLRRVVSKRCLNAIVTILLIMALNFALFRVMPGNPAELMKNRNPGKSNDAAYWRNVEIMGLNDSLPKQFVEYYYNTFTGNWGISYREELPVLDVMGEAILWTILLVGTGSALTFIIGVVLGKVAARKRRKWQDLSITGFGLFFYGMPVFWFAIILMVMFSNWIPILPSAGYMSSGTTPFPLTFAKVFDILKHMILPVTALTVGSIAGISLIMRNSLIDVLTEDYITTAYAKGLTEKQVVKKHASPNARLPIVTTIAMDTAFILGGVFQIEVVFSYKGIGWYTIDAINNKDFPMLQFIFFIGGVAVVVANLLADLILVKLDPRVKIT
jgi:peptide/nickel transport system permease protein